jgi:adenylylsulfate kinase
MNSGTVVWITGLPSAGKSTFAERAFTALRARGLPACLLDGDSVRHCLVPKLGYTPEERAEFYATLGNIAALLAAESLVVLVAATAHRREFRDRARAAAPAFVEVFVDTALEECTLRDTKGLYAAARSGSATAVPGADEAYEPPARPDVVAQGGLDDQAVERLVTLLASRAGDAEAPLAAPRSEPKSRGGA